ncbi:type IV secretion protein Rhs [Paenibacillus jamilae]|uniref:Type IV secretion protein Rhs n=1 Tax=Paenibacillus jamilae TaxID=114136 RepID=A0ACC5A0U3_9BACL|nr:phage minor capsid protein [Paenibacillus jamilae]KTS84473.1 type IV secretion protein Rhs [Paenibacillus jamilae]
MGKIPETNYDYDVAKLVRSYKQSVADILAELERTDTNGLSRDLAAKQLAEISEQLSALNAESASWVEKYIPKAARNGAAAAILALGTVKTMEEALKLVKFGSLNDRMVKSIIADTQEDLLAVTTNIERRIRNAVRAASANVLRRNMAAGINGHRTNKRDILAELRTNLGDALNTGIVDAAGRRWKPERYVDMLVRTKMMYAHNEATRNEALERGVMYATISRHGAKDACRSWEGKVVKLVPDAPGNYPMLDAAKSSKQVFHPNCKHVIVPIRDPESVG